MAGLLDYIEAPIHAIGGLFGGGNSAPAPDAAQLQPPAPAAHAANVLNSVLLGGLLGGAPAGGGTAPQAPTGQGDVVAPLARPQTNHLGDVLDSVFLGGRIAAARNAEYGAQNANYLAPLIAARTQRGLGALNPDQLAAYQRDPGGFLAADAKNYEPQKLAGGETLKQPNGNFTAPLLGMTKDGVGYSQTPTATTNTGSLTTIQSAAPGTTVGPIAPIGPVVAGGPQPVAGGPPVNPAASAPQIGQTPPLAAAGPQSGVPRGIRNNNPGNVKALPNGQMWNGQTGVDEMGHAIFANPTDGVHATLTNLQTYANKHGINTVAGIAQRWKGEGDASGYAQYLAKQVGVKPGDKIDLNDPAVLGKVAQGIFQFENGPEAMQTRFPGVAAQPPQIGQPPQTGPAAPAAPALGLPTSLQGKTAQILPPNDPRLKQFPPGAVVEQAPDGSLSVKQEGYSPTVLNTIRDGVLKSKQYDEYTQSNDAYKAMQSAAKLHQGGMRAYALRDTFARVINPGAVARAGTIEAIKQSQGLPANIQAYFMNLKGDGDVPPAIAQQILDVAHGFAQSHYGSAKALNDANTSLYTPKGVDPAAVTAPLEAAPERVDLGLQHNVPPPAQRKVGQSYLTPKGNLTWTGTGWRK